VLEERLIALDAVARAIADRAYEARLETQYRIEKSLQRIEASLAVLVRVRALNL
jgi:hypothetical protein